MLGRLFGRAADPSWRRAPCLRGVGKADLDRLARHVAERRLAPGEELVREGEEARELFFVADGELEVARAGDGRASVELGAVGPGGLIGEVSLLDRGPRSATARARTACVVYAFPFDALDGRTLGPEGRLAVLSNVGAGLAALVRAGGEASASATRKSEAMGRFVIAIMTLQSLYAILLTALPFLDGVLPSSTTYVSIPLQLVFGFVGVGFILRTGLPLRSFGLGFRDLIGSLVLSAAVTVPFLGVVTLLKLVVLRLRGVDLPVVEHPDVAAVFADPHVKMLFTVYAVSCLVQEIIVRSALQATLHVFWSGPRARASAIFVCALVFSTNHLHMSALFAAATLLPGLLWGWVFAVKRNIAGVTLSHIVVGAYVFFVLGVNVG